MWYTFCKVKRASGGQGYAGKYIVLVLVSALKPIGVWCMIRVDYYVKFNDLANVQVWYQYYTCM